MTKFAIISFPGNNCEAESLRAVKRAGMEGEVVLWNDPGMLDQTRLNEFDGYFLVGGFSYEDRGRSGVVAAQDPIMDVIKSEADCGKVVIGVCNGAQTLVESGLIPGFDNKGLAIALGWNEIGGWESVDSYFYNVWSYLKNTAPKGRCAFNNFEDTLHIPIAHGEGRFVMEPEVLEQLEANDQIVFKYADESGEVNPDFPYTPNGSMASAAAICNPAGNVMAIMPHPERDPKGNGGLIFESIKRWIENSKLKTQNSNYKSLGNYECKDDVRAPEPADIEVFVRLIITDNTERTIEEALVRKGFDLHLDRYEYFGITLKPGTDVREATQRIMETGELANFNKHLVYIRTKEATFSYDAASGLTPKELRFDRFAVVCQRSDFAGQGRAAVINHHTGGILKSVRAGVLWHFSGTDDRTIDEVIRSKVLYNPHSMYLLRK